MTNEASSEPVERPIGVSVAFRPLFCWIPIAILLLCYDYHRINSRKTYIQAHLTLNGEPVPSGAKIIMEVDGKPWNFRSQVPIPIGNRKITLSAPDATTFSTNLFVWYGENHLGETPLYRQRGELELDVSPLAKTIELKGEYNSFDLRYVTGVRTNLPVGSYTMRVHFDDIVEDHRTEVMANRVTTKKIVGNCGVLELTANQNGSQFTVRNAKNTRYFLKDGEFPKTLILPVGDYFITAWVGNYRKSSSVTIGRGTTESLNVVFEYGTLDLETDPMGVSISSSGKALGKTPLEISLVPGDQEIRLSLDGYASINLPINIKANQVTAVRTNLVHLGFSRAVDLAERAASRENYSEAISQLRQALAIEPDDVNLRTKLKRYEGIQAKLDHEKLISNRLRDAVNYFALVTGKVQHGELFDAHQWAFKKDFDQVSRAVVKTIADGPENYSLESEQALGEDKKMFVGVVKGFRSLGQRCMILVTEIQPNQVDVQAKFWEYVTGNKITLGFGGIDKSSLTPLHPKYFQTNLRDEVNQRRKKTAEDFRAALIRHLN